ncbi:MAG: outer membrane protein assembly factor BamA [Methylotetracoccus sp.]
MMRTRRALAFLLLWTHALAPWAFDTFRIESIRIQGLQRVSEGTVLNYLPVRVGDVFDQKESTESIKALFKTGFFKDVRLEHDGGTLVVLVEERPSIASISIDGNKDLSTEELTKALKGIGLSEGKVFDRQILDKVEQELRRQYYSRGKYGLQIASEVTDLERNRVAIAIKITEGKVAQIKQINVVGNAVFSDEDLIDEFELSTTNWLSWYTKDDQYSKQKLSADLERLRSYYLDRGFIKFEIESTQVSITPNKKEIYVTINVREGEVYTVNEVKLTGKLIVPPDQLLPLVKIGPEDTFSRKAATESSKGMSDRLGEEGFIFANVNMVPDINEDQKTVNITFFVDPGKQVYVRRINFTGNTRTRDEVLRREMRQMEAAWASSTKIERSKMRLERLGFFQEVNVETPAVPGTSDQIDVNYSVVEKASGNIMAGVGYSQVQGIILNASVTQDNVFGSGKRVNFTFNNSQVNTIYQLGFLDPYLSLDGISGGFDLAYRRSNFAQANIAAYLTNIGSAGFNFGIPLSEFDSLRSNFDFENTQIRTTNNSPLEITDYIAQNGNDFNTYSVALGYTHDTLNRAIFATEGGTHTLSGLITMPFSDLEYFKLSLRSRQYFGLAKDLTLLLGGEIAYGSGYAQTGTLPFFENYYAGGPNSVRGFLQNSLGPKATYPPGVQGNTNLPLGGSSKLIGTVELLMPLPFVKESKNIRVGPFVDAGNVFAGSFDFGDIRYSTGIAARWLSPFGALMFSVAQPLNSKHGDRIQNFQFNFGSGF